MAHEYGHVIYELLGWRAGNDQAINDMVAEKLEAERLNWDIICSDVSRYAGKSKEFNELVAELVSDYLTSKRPRQISKIVYTGLVELFRRKL